jgi:hypothetical protein
VYRVLRRIFGLKRDEVAGGWRKLHNEELHDLCYYQSKLEWSSRGGWDWQGMWHNLGENGNAYSLLRGKPEGKRLLRRPCHRWMDNIKINLRKLGWGGADWIGLAQDRDKWRAIMTLAMNLWFP